MKQAIRWSRAVTTALLLAAPAMAMAADAQHIDIGKKGEVDFTRPMHLGSTLVKPGHYYLQHQTDESEHFLIVRGRRILYRPGGHSVWPAARELARVRCTAAMLSDKTPETAVYYTVEPDGSGTVIQIRIRGESAEHIIALRLATERPTTSP